MHNQQEKKVVIIGGGPAGLMAAEVVSQAGLPVHLYDAMPSLGRKFLLAGKGGLNLTHSEPFDSFLDRYGSRRPQIEPMLAQFGPEDLRTWAHDLGIETFVGSSGRIFPEEMKAAPLLRRWLSRLRASGVQIYVRHRWLGWDENGRLRFETPDGEELVAGTAVILALGGGSWARLGSDGTWVSLLEEKGVQIAPLQPTNCGFEVNWSEHFRTRFAGEPLKSVVLNFKNHEGKAFSRQGEFIVSEYGVEGSLIYAASAMVREEINVHGKVIIELDLSPNRTEAQLIERLAQPRGKRSMSSHLQSKVGIKGVKAALLREFVPKSEFANPEHLAKWIKALPIPLLGPRPIDEAISTAGGVMFASLDANLMVNHLPGLFCAGEMLDWEAPTGGYLLTACFASGYVAGNGVLNFLR